MKITASINRNKKERNSRSLACVYVQSRDNKKFVFFPFADDLQKRTERALKVVQEQQQQQQQQQTSKLGRSRLANQRSSHLRDLLTFRRQTNADLTSMREMTSQSRRSTICDDGRSSLIGFDATHLSPRDGLLAIAKDAHKKHTSLAHIFASNHQLDRRNKINT